MTEIVIFIKHNEVKKILHTKVIIRGVQIIKHNVLNKFLLTNVVIRGVQNMHNVWKCKNEETDGFIMFTVR